MSVAGKAYEAFIAAEIKFFEMVGAELVEPEEQKRRIGICESNECGEFDPGMRKCNECKCLMDCKTALLNNPLADKEKIIKCPKNLW